VLLVYHYCLLHSLESHIHCASPSHLNHHNQEEYLDNAAFKENVLPVFQQVYPSFMFQYVKLCVLRALKVHSG
jgi:hypothetical protein